MPFRFVCEGIASVHGLADPGGLKTMSLHALRGAAAGLALALAFCLWERDGAAQVGKSLGRPKAAEAAPATESAPEAA